MTYYAYADVNYYEMEGEWNLVHEPVGIFDTVDEAQAACRARRGDHITWSAVGNSWQGDIDPNSGSVTFYIQPSR